jgi:hypothetical protein
MSRQAALQKLDQGILPHADAGNRRQTHNARDCALTLRFEALRPKLRRSLRET